MSTQETAKDRDGAGGGPDELARAEDHFRFAQQMVAALEGEAVDGRCDAGDLAYWKAERDECETWLMDLRAMAEAEARGCRSR